MPRQIAKVDKSQREIIATMRAAGYRVIDTHNLGEGFPDLVIIGKGGQVALLTEIKTPGLEQVTRAEARFMLNIVMPVYRIIESPLEMLEALEASGI